MNNCLCRCRSSKRLHKTFHSKNIFDNLFGDQQQCRLVEIVYFKKAMLQVTKSAVADSEHLQRRNDINSKFWEVLRKMSPDYPIELINGLKIRTIFKEDYTGFWCGYELISGTETLTGENSEKKLITDLFKKELSKIESNKNWIGWFYPKQFKKDEKFIDNAGLISKIISDDSYIEDLVKKIVEEEKEISGLLKKVLKENNFI